MNIPVKFFILINIIIQSCNTYNMNILQNEILSSDFNSNYNDQNGCNDFETPNYDHYFISSSNGGSRRKLSVMETNIKSSDFNNQDYIDISCNTNAERVLKNISSRKLYETTTTIQYSYMDSDNCPTSRMLLESTIQDSGGYRNDFEHDINQFGCCLYEKLSDVISNIQQNNMVCPLHEFMKQYIIHLFEHSSYCEIYKENLMNSYFPTYENYPYLIPAPDKPKIYELEYFTNVFKEIFPDLNQDTQIENLYNVFLPFINSLQECLDWVDNYNDNNDNVDDGKVLKYGIKSSEYLYGKYILFVNSIISKHNDLKINKNFHRKIFNKFQDTLNIKYYAIRFHDRNFMKLNNEFPEYPRMNTRKFADNMDIKNLCDGVCSDDIIDKLHSELESLETVMRVLLLGDIQSIHRKYQMTDTTFNGVEKTPQNKYTFMVTLHKQINIGTAFCGGVLISQCHVLTAAHCVDGDNEDFQNELYVTVGGYFSEVQDNDGTVIKVEKITMHPNYQSITYENDIAVLKLEHCNNNNNIIIPNLAQNEEEIRDLQIMNAEVKMFGWGTNTEGGEMAETLEMHNLNLVNTRECQAKLQDAVNELVNVKNDQDNLHVPIDDSIICTEGNFGSAVCYGDSGGPLVLFDPVDPAAIPTVIGVVNFGIPCGSGYPDAYAAVAHHRQFIKDNTIDSRRILSDMEQGSSPTWISLNTNDYKSDIQQSLDNYVAINYIDQWMYLMLVNGKLYPITKFHLPIWTNQDPQNVESKVIPISSIQKNEPIVRLLQNELAYCSGKKEIIYYIDSDKKIFRLCEKNDGIYYCVPNSITTTVAHPINCDHYIRSGTYNNEHSFGNEKEIVLINEKYIYELRNHNSGYNYFYYSTKALKFHPITSDIHFHEDFNKIIDITNILNDSNNNLFSSDNHAKQNFKPSWELNGYFRHHATIYYIQGKKKMVVCVSTSQNSIYECLIQLPSNTAVFNTKYASSFETVDYFTYMNMSPSNNRFTFQLLPDKNIKSNDFIQCTDMADQYFYNPHGNFALYTNIMKDFDPPINTVVKPFNCKGFHLFQYMPKEIKATNNERILLRCMNQATTSNNNAQERWFMSTRDGKYVQITHFDNPDRTTIIDLDKIFQKSVTPLYSTDCESLESKPLFHFLKEDFYANDLGVTDGDTIKCLNDPNYYRYTIAKTTVYKYEYANENLPNDYSSAVQLNCDFIPTGRCLIESDPSFNDCLENQRDYNYRGYDINSNNFAIIEQYQIIKCLNHDENFYYLYSNNELFKSTNNDILESWDPNYKNSAITIRCNNLHKNSILLKAKIQQHRLVKCTDDMYEAKSYQYLHNNILYQMCWVNLSNNDAFCKYPKNQLIFPENGNVPEVECRFYVRGNKFNYGHKVRQIFIDTDGNYLNNNALYKCDDDNVSYYRLVIWGAKEIDYKMYQYESKTTLELHHGPINENVIHEIDCQNLVKSNIKIGTDLKIFFSQIRNQGEFSERFKIPN